jgi:hypothetical protein
MKYIVYVKEDGQWVEQGDGPLTQKQAERIAHGQKETLARARGTAGRHPVADG